MKPTNAGAGLALETMDRLGRRPPPDDCAWIDELFLEWSRLPVATSAIGRALARGAGVWDSGMREQTARSQTPGGEWLRPSGRTGLFPSEVYSGAVAASGEAPVITEQHVAQAIAAASPTGLRSIGIDPERFLARVREHEQNGASLQQPSPQLAGRQSSSALVRDEIWEVAGHAFGGGKWDDAIFDAMRMVEAKLQQRLGSKKIGDKLIAEAFEPPDSPRVRISPDRLDNERLAQVFRGTLGYLKGSRSHGEAPSVPCRDADSCLRVLVVTSYLLDQLDLDEAAAPAIVAIRLEGSDAVEIETLRCSDTAQVLVDDRVAKTLSRSGGVLRVGLPGPGSHRLTLVDGGRKSPAFAFEVEAVVDDANFHLVEAIELPLFDSMAATSRRPETAIRLSSYEGGRRFRRYFPAGRNFAADEYVDWTWTSPLTIAESWVKDRSEVAYAWTASMAFTGQRIGQRGTPRLARIELRPRVVRARPGERVPLRVVGYWRDGPVCWREDLSGQAVIESNDVAVATIDPRRATARGVGPGSTSLRARLGQLFDTADVRVAAQQKGEVAEYVGGIRRMVRLAYGPDGLVIADQSSRLIRVSRDGGIDYFAGVNMPETVPNGMDYLAIDPTGNIFVRAPWLQSVLRLDRASGFARSETLLTSRTGTALTALAWAEPLGGLVVGDTEGDLFLCRNGTVEVWGRLPFFITDLAAASDGMLALGARSGTGYMKIDWDGHAEFCALPLDQGVGLVALLPRNDEVLFVDSNGGQLLTYRDGAVSALAGGFQSPQSLATDDDGTVFVANFGGDTISRVF